MLDAGVDGLLQRTVEQAPCHSDTNIEIREAPGKGLGMFARRKISNGGTILLEHPVVVTPYVIGLSVPLSQLFADIFGRLTQPVFRELMDLSSAFWGDAKDIHEAIMRVNALAIQLAVPGGEFAELSTHRGIFLKTSRCNHSCGPNAKWDWNQKTFSLSLTAVRPIDAGEEITIPYVAPDMLSDLRRDTLSTLYGFECVCSYCQLPEDKIRQSDLARTTLSAMWGDAAAEAGLPSFEKWCLDPELSDDVLINAHVRALHLIEREGLQILDTHGHTEAEAGGVGGAHPERDIGRHLDLIAMCYGALEDADNFRKWVERAGEARLRCRPEQRLAFQKWLSNPISFPVWGWRRAFCGGGEEGDKVAGLSACVSMGVFEFV
ncbi:hypothetical protein B0H34DRAFT_784605 [Crassisporium funariophilum]|nr:hypothetical protein B0H34DRAFT_784605 [Crassisporium funariophilum]